MTAVTGDARGLKSLIARDYDLAATGFAARADRLVYTHLAAPLAEAVAGMDGPVLDVASGTGALARQLPRVVALDLSREQLVHNPTPLRVAGDAEALPFAAGCFAAVACAFGVNHFPDPGAAVREMARLAPVVALLTWRRPDPDFAPKQAVSDALVRHAGRSGNDVRSAIESMGELVGSADALAELLEGAGLRAQARTVTVDVPWPGAEEFVDYRLSMPGVPEMPPDVAQAVRRDAVEAVRALPESAIEWRATLVLAVGRAAGGRANL